LKNHGISLEHHAGTEDDSVPWASCDFERTMPPSAFEGLQVPGGDACVFVLSTDVDFVSTVRRVSGAHHAVVTVTDWLALVEGVTDGRCAVAVIDAAAAGSLERRITELGRFPAPPVIISAATLNDAPASMKALTERKIHRLLLKPASPGNTRLSLEAAIHRWRQLHDERALPLPALVSAQPPPQNRTASVGHRSLWLGGMAVLFVLIAVTGLLGRSTPGPVVESSPPSLAAVGRITPGASQGAFAMPGDPLAEELAYADSALEVGLLADPPFDNALEGYATILAQDAGHGAARAGLAATVNLLLARAENALLDGSFDLAATALDHVRVVRPESDRLAFLYTQLERARALTAEPAAVDARESRPDGAATELDRLLRLARDRMQEGKLVVPSGDNAVAYYVRSAAIDADAPGVRNLRANLRAALLATAQTLLASREVERVESLIVGLRAVGASTAILADLDRRLSVLNVELQREREAGLLNLGLARLSSGRLATPADDSAAFYLASLMHQDASHPELAGFRAQLSDALAERVREAVAQAEWSLSMELLAALQQIEADPLLISALAKGREVALAQAEFLATAVPAADLRLIVAGAPVYPGAALRNNLEGWVDLEFVVDRQGVPRDIVVTEAEPVGRFDRAAMDAVARHRFAPYAQDGVVYERRARTRMRFTLTD
jgi:TonB family protein